MWSPSVAIANPSNWVAMSLAGRPCSDGVLPENHHGKQWGKQLPKGLAAAHTSPLAAVSLGQGNLWGLKTLGPGRGAKAPTEPL